MSLLVCSRWCLEPSTSRNRSHGTLCYPPFQEDNIVREDYRKLEEEDFSDLEEQEEDTSDREKQEQDDVDSDDNDLC